MARQIQLSILPSSTPKITGMDIAARYIPLTSVAGDFYDFIVVDELSGLGSTLRERTEELRSSVNRGLLSRKKRVSVRIGKELHDEISWFAEQSSIVVTQPFLRLNGVFLVASNGLVAPHPL